MNNRTFALSPPLLFSFMFFSPLLFCGKDVAKLESIYGEAIAAYDRHDLVKAETLFRQVYAEDPGFHQTCLLLGRTLFYKKQPGEAEELIEEAHERNPASADALFWLAKLKARDSEKHQEALGMLDTLLRNDSSHVEAWILKGRLLQGRDRPDEAILAYRNAIESGTKVALAHIELGNLYARAGLEDRARAEYARARQIAVNEPSILGLIREPQAVPPATPATNGVAREEKR